MYDIIIVGAGTAGLTAAIYGVRAGKSVLVLEAKTYGGQIINTPKIENYPGIKDLSGFESVSYTHLFPFLSILCMSMAYRKLTL